MILLNLFLYFLDFSTPIAYFTRLRHREIFLQTSDIQASPNISFYHYIILVDSFYHIKIHLGIILMLYH